MAGEKQIFKRKFKRRRKVNPVLWAWLFIIFMCIAFWGTIIKLFIL